MESEKLLQNLNITVFFNTLSEEDKVKFMTYLIDNVYDYEEDDNKDEEQNEDVLSFMRKNSKYAQAVMNKLNDKDSDECEPKTLEQNDKHIQKLVEDFKRLREDKLTRIVNG